MNRRIVALLGIAVAILIIVAAVGYYFVSSGSHQISGVNETPSPLSTGTGTPALDKGCGITKTSSGYTFSWLHVSNGYIEAASGCIVDLKGFNWSQIEFGDGVGGGRKTQISEQGIAWYNQTFHMNVWRIPVNLTWWNNNVEVPKVNMPYQQWIRQIISWSEQNGDYVILTTGPQFSNPPCGKTVKFCPMQNQGQKNYAQGIGAVTQLTTGQYIQPAITMWTSMAKLYANDPAVLYDSWNEMHNIDAQTWQNSENTLIASIRTQNPRSLVFLGGPNYKGNINDIIQGQVPDFSQPNLVYDFHVYDGFHGTYNGKKCGEPNSDLWKGWPTVADQQVGFAQQHGKAVSFTEWGGCNDFPTYNQDITSFALAHHICLVYYDETNVAVNNNGSYELTSNGQRVQAAYALM
jgi:hypothetical protein